MPVFIDQSGQDAFGGVTLSLGYAIVRDQTAQHDDAGQLGLMVEYKVSKRTNVYGALSFLFNVTSPNIHWQVPRMQDRLRAVRVPMRAACKCVSRIASSFSARAAA